MKEEEMITIASLINQVINYVQANSEQTFEQFKTVIKQSNELLEVKQRVTDLTARFPLFI